MSKTREVFTSPVGRLVQGDCFEAQTKDQQGNPRVIKTGPNAGQPNPVFFIAVAFPKLVNGVANPEFAAFFALIDRVSRLEWPALFPDPNGGCVNPKFSAKWIDGDGLDDSGKSNATKEGFAGHWVVRFSSAYAPKVVVPGGNGTWEATTDKSRIKRGYFIRVAGSMTGNDNAQNPGIYINLDMIALDGIGPEIVSGPDATTAFGASKPIAAGPGAGMAMPSNPAAPVVAGSAPPVPGAPAAPLVPASPVVAPIAAAPSAPPAPTPPSAPIATISPSRTMTAAAAGQTYEAFIAAGWTDDQLVANGYMIVG